MRTAMPVRSCLTKWAALCSLLVACGASAGVPTTQPLSPGVGTPTETTQGAVTTTILVGDDDGVTRTTNDVPGGAYEYQILPGEVELYSEVAVRGVVVDIDPARLDTPSGGWDPPPGQTHGYAPDVLTDVTLVVTEVLGRRVGAPQVNVGESMIITFLGGAFTFEATAEQVAEMDLVDVDPGDENDGTPSVGSPIAGPLALTRSSSMAPSFSEGEQLVVFLTHGREPLANGVYPWVAGDLGGPTVFVVLGTELAANAVGSRADSVAVAELIEAGRRLSLLGGPACPPMAARCP